ncbi:MAG: tetratricopeptide repeat protein [Rhodospirillales bacterium]|nr:tetratricopeptide repeat protein [Rhodospirillales bacterium]
MTDPAPAGSPAEIAVPRAELFALAAEHERAGRLGDAARLLSHLLAADADAADALHLMGIIAYRQGDIARALDLIERALARGLDQPLYLRNIAEVYRALGRLDQARTAAEAAVALHRGDPLSLANLAIIHGDRLELDQAVAAAEAALALDPDNAAAHFERGEARLLRGDLPGGFADMEWRFALDGAAPPLPNTDRPAWDGAPMASGRLLLIGDQGFGDVIQFARYIPWVQSRVADLVIGASRPLIGLLRQITDAPIRDTWRGIPDFAAWTTLSGLPRLAGTTLATIPAPIPYLHADPARITRWRARLDQLCPPGMARIGIAWAGRAAHKNDRNRSAGLAAFAPLLARGDCVFVGVQKGPAVAQVASYTGAAPLVHLGPELGDFEDTAAVLTTLDLLVSVDTSVVHLAGALGRPAWVALPYAPDWRWMLGRADTPWYPTLRLFRQTSPGAWDGVMADIAAALDARGKP